MTGTRHLEHDWHPDPVPDNVHWGEGTWLYSSYAFRHSRSRMDPAVSIGRNTGIYHPTHFDLGPEGSVTIGDHCTLVSVLICTNGRIEIGDLVLLAHGVVVTGDPAAVPGRGEPGTRIRIGNNVWVGTNAVILDGADIGEDSVIGAGSVVDFPVPPGHLAAGNPARVLKAIG